MAEIAVGISFVSAAQARSNLAQALRQISGTSLDSLADSSAPATAVLLADSEAKSSSLFEKARAIAQNLWREQLGAVQVWLG